MSDHRVGPIQFKSKTNGGVVECSCGEVIHDDFNLYDAFNTHRATNGEPKKNVGQMSFAARGEPNVWRSEYRSAWLRRG